MAYDEDLANRIREIVSGEPGLREKRMFGGLAFLVNGNMAVSASRVGGILLRVDPAQVSPLLAKPHVQQARMGGRLLDGWLRVEADALRQTRDLRRWVGYGLEYARTLPPKGG